MASPQSKSNSMTDRLSMDQLREKGSEIKHNLQDMGSAAKAAVQTQYEGVRDTVTTYVDQSRERAMEFEESLETRIREKPLSSVLIASGIGFVLGMMWMRK